MTPPASRAGGIPKMSMEMTFAGELPDTDLSANKRRVRHWAKQAGDTKAARELAWTLILREVDRQSPQRPHEIPLPWHVTWRVHWPKGQRAYDADSLAPMLKPWMDALCCPLFGPKTDSPRYVRRVSYESIPTSPEGPAIVLTIEEA